MKHTRFFSLLALLALPMIASAQPDPNNAPKGENPANRNRPARGGRGQNLTPEQIKTLVQANMRRQLTQANITNTAQQEAVMAYVTGEYEARQKLAQTTRTLQTGLRNPAITDAQIAGLLNDYNAAAADDKVRHQKALDTLKNTIDVTQFPRLEATLTLAGLYGDAPAANLALANILGGMGGGNRLRANARNGAGAIAGGAAGAEGDVPAGGNMGGARGNMLNRRNQRAPF